MSLKAGIVGLPNVGKSTLFNAITNSRVMAANYPFATIEPNIGVVEVKDERLTRIAEIFNPQKTIYATFEFIDIAGLVKGASNGEGLGNKFLANIREVDAICHVVRCYDNNNIEHVYETVDPLRDIEIINYELILADISSIENRLPRLSKRLKASSDLEAKKEAMYLEKFLEVLKEGKLANSIITDADDSDFIRRLNLLTTKKMIYVCNIAEEDINNPLNNKYYQAVSKQALKENTEIVAISAKIEEELSDMDSVSKKEFLNSLDINESGLDNLIKVAYKTLGLCTYFTAGEKECRAWTFNNGANAANCAGIIHSDFEKGFIKAEVYTFDDLITFGTYNKLKEAGKIRLEGKDYLTKDGDIMLFRFNV